MNNNKSIHLQKLELRIFNLRAKMKLCNNTMDYWSLQLEVYKLTDELYTIKENLKKDSEACLKKT